MAQKSLQLPEKPKAPDTPKIKVEKIEKNQKNETNKKIENNENHENNKKQEETTKNGENTKTGHQPDEKDPQAKSASVTPAPGISETQPTHGVQRLWVWKYFTDKPDDDKVLCTVISKDNGRPCNVLLARDHSGSTKSMGEHLWRKHQIVDPSKVESGLQDISVMIKKRKLENVSHSLMMYHTVPHFLILRSSSICFTQFIELQLRH
jgi:hypothetical protein